MLDVGVVGGGDRGPQEERVPDRIIELLVLHDVAAVSEEEGRDRP